MQQTNLLPFFLLFFYFFPFPLQWCWLSWIIKDRAIIPGHGPPTLTCWWLPKIVLPAPSQSQHSLCRAVSGDVVRQLRRRESERVCARVREKSRAGSQGCYSVLFVATTHCYRVVAAWRRSSLQFLSLFLSHTRSSSHFCPVTWSLPHAYCLCTSFLLLPPLLLTGSSPSEYWYLECVAAACSWN